MCFPVSSNTEVQPDCKRLLNCIESSCDDGNVMFKYILTTVRGILILAIDAVSMKNRGNIFTTAWQQKLPNAIAHRWLWYTWSANGRIRTADFVHAASDTYVFRTKPVKKFAYIGSQSHHNKRVPHHYHQGSHYGKYIGITWSCVKEMKLPNSITHRWFPNACFSTKWIHTLYRARIVLR